jgi:integrase
MLSYAAEEGILHAVPRIKLRREYGREAIIDPRTESLLLKFAPAPLGDVLVIMLDCGMRPEEVLRMRWEHIYWDRKRLLVPYGKSSRSTRLLPLSERMEVRLKARQSDSEWVFPSMQVTRRKSRSQSGHRSSVGTQWLDTVVTVNAEAEKHGVSPVSSAVVLYSARHTFATRYLDEGGDIASLMKLLGHSGLRTTQRYLHPEIEKAAAIVNRRNNRAFQLPDALSDDALDRDAEAFSSLAERFDGLGMG